MSSTNNPPDFGAIDWVSLAKSLGIYLPTKDGVVHYRYYSDAERIALAEHLAQMVCQDSVTKDYITEELNTRVLRGEITTFDKAWIRLLMNRTLRNSGHR
ncbi:hypothetical protein D1872_51800 [compost metagenome]